MQSISSSATATCNFQLPSRSATTNTSNKFINFNPCSTYLHISDFLEHCFSKFSISVFILPIIWYSSLYATITSFDTLEHNFSQSFLSASLYITHSSEVCSAQNTSQFRFPKPSLMICIPSKERTYGLLIELI